MSKANVVAKFSFTREPGYLYFVDKQGDISRTKRSRGHYRDKHPHEKVMKTGLKKEKNLWYFVRGDGTVCTLTPKNLKK
jgi:hypothetical protein